MPTQTEFEQAAHTLRGSLDALHASRRHLAGAQGTEAITGGPIAAVVDAALTVSQANIDRLANQVEHLAVVCDGRARVCAEHAAALARWQARYSLWEREMWRYRMAIDDPLAHVPWPGPAPVRPAAPYAWVAPS